MFSKNDNLAEQALCANIIALEDIISKTIENYDGGDTIQIPYEDWTFLSPIERDYVINGIYCKLNGN